MDQLPLFREPPLKPPNAPAKASALSAAGLKAANCLQPNTVQSFRLPLLMSNPFSTHARRMSKNSWLASRPWKISKMSKPRKLPA